MLQNTGRTNTLGNSRPTQNNNSMKKFFRRLSLIITLQTLIISALAAVSTYFCVKYNWKANFSLTLVATSIVFPIVFSIGGAYKRREVALREYAAIKGYLRAIYFASRDWMPIVKPENVTKMEKIIERFFTNIRTLFSQSTEHLEEGEKAVYKDFSDFSDYIKHDLREEGLSAGECSRTNQFLQKMLISFESLKHIYQYRTPRTLRAFSELFIKVLPIAYGPYFAQINVSAPGLSYVIPVLLTMVIVSLHNIQDHLENPFDQVGEDDIKFNVEKFVENLKAT